MRKHKPATEVRRPPPHPKPAAPKAQPIFGREQGFGKILITGSIARFMPGAFQAVYNGTKAFLDSFSYALRDELKHSGITVTWLLPGATETSFFERAGMLDTKVGTEEKDDPADVAKEGFEPSSGMGYRNRGPVTAQTAAQSQRDETKATIAKSPLVSGVTAGLSDRLDPDCGF